MRNRGWKGRSNFSSHCRMTFCSIYLNWCKQYDMTRYEEGRGGGGSLQVWVIQMVRFSAWIRQGLHCDCWQEISTFGSPGE